MKPIRAATQVAAALSAAPSLQPSAPNADAPHRGLSRPGWTRRLRAAALLTGLATTVLVTGCGGKDDDEPAPPPVATPAPAPVPAPAPAPVVAVLKAAADVGTPITTTQLDAVVAASNAAGLAGAARCNVQIVEILYGTPAPDGTSVNASGVVMIPSGPSCVGPYPLVAYSRGTDLDKARSLATPGDPEAQLVAALLASQGFVVAATDYLGYAKSTFPSHPYLHSASEATSNLDAMRAARELGAARSIALNGKVFVTGYSQGGHASLSTQRLIESTFASEFALAGAGHMSGPYNLVGSILSAIDALPLGELGSTYYLPFAVTSLQAVYRDVYTTPGQFFRAPYGETIENLFPGPADVSVTDLIRDGKLPILLDSLITDDFETAARNPASTLRRALAANSPIDFAPRTPTLLCGGSRDPVVTFSNTTDAAASFQALGASTVTVFDVENEPAYDSLLRDDVIPVDFYTGYHASLVPPLCLLQVRNRFLTQ